jgi:hypothetical protein
MEQDEIKKGFELMAAAQKASDIKFEQLTTLIEKNATEVNSSLRKHDERFEFLAMGQKESTDRLDLLVVAQRELADRVDAKIDVLSDRVNALSNRVDAKIDALSNRVDAEIHDLAVVVNAFSTQVEQRFDIIETKMVTKDDLKREFDGFRMQMATKPYLDDKLADVRADSGRLLRKEDAKVNAVIDNLENKEIINEEESQALINLGPFIQTSISTSQ